VPISTGDPKKTASVKDNEKLKETRKTS